MTVPRARGPNARPRLEVLVPLSLLNLVVVALVWKIYPGTDSIDSFSEAIGPSLVLLVVNILMILGVGAVLREQGRRERERIEAKQRALELGAEPVSDVAPAGAGR